MEQLMDDICGELHNYFVIREAVHGGEFTIEDGGIIADFLRPGQYFRVMGSVFNDGVWIYPATDMQEETFRGEILPMAVPPAFLAMLEEIQDWIAQYGSETASGPYTSESFNNYSYTKATGANADGSWAPVSWRNVFGAKMNRWRRLP